VAEPEVEAAWRAEFGRIHETEASHNSNAVINGAKAAFRWSGDAAEARRLKEEHTHHYARWTFVGASAAAIVGLIGVGLSFLN
jgi:hypothetical protein